MLTSASSANNLPFCFYLVTVLKGLKLQGLKMAGVFLLIRVLTTVFSVVFGAVSWKKYSVGFPMMMAYTLESLEVYLRREK